MFSYAIVLNLDTLTEKTIFELWEKLRLEGISDYGFAHAGKAPHITLADFEQVDLEVLKMELKTYCSKHESLTIHLDCSARFIKNGTVYITASESTGLYELHKSVLNEVKSIQLSETSFCCKEKWQPHLTIASRLDEDKMIIVEQYLKDKLPLKGQLKSISLLRLEEDVNGRVVGQEVVEIFNFK